jgi:hypothetical protein
MTKSKTKFEKYTKIVCKETGSIGVIIEKRGREDLYLVEWLKCIQGERIDKWCKGCSQCEENGKCYFTIRDFSIRSNEDSWMIRIPKNWKRVGAGIYEVMWTGEFNVIDKLNKKEDNVIIRSIRFLDGIKTQIKEYV